VAANKKEKTVTSTQKPTVALTLGDPAGIGAELVAKLLTRRATVQQAKVVLVGDAWLWQEGQAIAGLEVPTRPVRGFAEVVEASDEMPLFLAVDSVRSGDVPRAQASAAGGASVLKILAQCLDAASAGQVDAICFAPLNKQAMKMSGMAFSDELHYFADHLHVQSYVCEFNALDDLWTSRISSHVPMAEIGRYITKERIKDGTKLIYEALRAAGFERPKVAVAALNPHGGDGGTCGREEVDIIAPAVRELNAEGYPVAGPFPADTIFRRARDGQLNGIVTMYHDQGQIAIKLLGFERGVTIQGGLPIPITTPAHGTAFDIAGRNKANVEATEQAFLTACRMGSAKGRGV
jgi:4-hydroxythreonine-4-phosphate dehydrogenase